MEEQTARMDSRVDAIFRLVQGRINFTNLVPTCIEIAQEVEQLKGIKGAEKLNLLQSVLRHHVQQSPISMAEKEQYYHIIDTVVPMVVQAAIFATKNPVVKRVQSVCCGCWTKK